MENVFDALCAALTEPENKKLFLDAEGVDLMVLMMKYANCFLFRLRELILLIQRQEGLSDAMY